MRTPRRLVVACVVPALVLGGCATYPTAAPALGQDAATAERDARECQERATRAVDSPVLGALKGKIVPALAGAVLGGGFGLALVAGDSNTSPARDPYLDLAIIGGGVALGFVVGSIVGTFAGAGRASELSQARDEVFARCMSQRGYRF